MLLVYELTTRNKFRLYDRVESIRRRLLKEKIEAGWIDDND